MIGGVEVWRYFWGRGLRSVDLILCRAGASEINFSPVAKSCFLYISGANVCLMHCWLLLLVVLSEQGKGEEKTVDMYVSFALMYGAVVLAW